MCVQDHVLFGNIERAYYFSNTDHKLKRCKIKLLS